MKWILLITSIVLMIIAYATISPTYVQLSVVFLMLSLGISTLRNERR